MLSGGPMDDLRGLLGTIVMWTQLLAQAPPDARPVAPSKVSDTVRRTTARMERLIDDLSDFASIEAGRLAIVKAPQPVAQLIREAVDGSAMQAAEKSVRLEYEGHTRVAGTYDLPTVLVTPGTADPYAGLRRHREQLAARGAAPRIATRPTADWWHEPIFCGWGAQRSLAGQNGGSPADYATQASYDAFLGHLEERSVVPGTIVIDDKWQGAYGTCEPDPAKWPDLRGWVAARHTTASICAPATVRLPSRR